MEYWVPLSSTQSTAMSARLEKSGGSLQLKHHIEKLKFPELLALALISLGASGATLFGNNGT